MTTSDDEYFNILFVGRSGLGKSTTGNKLIKGHSENEHSNIGEYVGQLGIHLKQSKGETCAFSERKPGSYVSCTKQCRVLLNEKEGVCVIDTVGFADSGVAEQKKIGVREANLKLVYSTYSKVNGNEISPCSLFFTCSWNLGNCR